MRKMDDSGTVISTGDQKFVMNPHIEEDWELYIKQEDGRLHFKGDVEESVEMFFGFVVKLFNDYLEKKNE